MTGISMAATRKKRDPQATRQQILRCASELLVQGNGALEMSWVANAAGVSQGLAYHHFGSKEGLFLAVVNDFYDRLEQDVLMPKLDDIPDWERRESERTRRYIDFLLDDPLGPVVIGRLAHSPALSALDSQRWEGLITVAARNIAQGQKSGRIVASESSELLAAMVLGAIRAGVARVINSESKVNRARLARDTWEFICRGLSLRREGEHEHN